MFTDILTEDDFKCSVFGQEKIVRIKEQVKKMFENMIKESGRSSLSSCKVFSFTHCLQKDNRTSRKLQCIHP